jgi:hypothetical protein
MSGPRTPPTDGDEVGRRLLDDDAFNDLMEAEFAAAGAPRDDLARARVWKRIAARTARPSRRRAAMSAVAAAVIAVVVGGTFLEQQHVGDGGREKGKTKPRSLTLTVAQRGAGGTLTPLAGGASVQVPAGRTLVFSTWAPPGTRIVLLAQPRGQGAHVAAQFVPKDAAAATLIEKDGALFAYVVDPGDVVRFCALGVAEGEGLLDAGSPRVAATLEGAADESACIKVREGAEAP